MTHSPPLQLASPRRSAGSRAEGLRGASRPAVPRAAASFAAGALFVLTCGGVPPLVAAHEFEQGDLFVDHPFAPATPPGVSSAAGYLTVTNNGEESERLLGGEAAFAGGGVELHRTTVENDVARMRELSEGLLIEAGETVSLAPGGTHLMFTGLEAPLVDGESLEATLRFERAGEVRVVFNVERPGSGTDSMDHDAMDHGEMDHGAMDSGRTVDEKISHDGMDHGDR